MSTRYLPRLGDLPKERHQLPPYQVGHWVLAGTPVAEPYPCTCRYDPCRYERCADRNRADRAQVAELLPPGCCGRPDAATPRAPRKPGEATGTPGGHSDGPGGVPGAPRGSGSDLTTWERRLPTAPGAPVADSELWGAVLADAPPDWEGIDEVSLVHGETSEGDFGYSVPTEDFQPLREVPETIWGLASIKRRAREAQCDCATPWDADPPALLVAANAKAGTTVVMHFVLSDKPGADVRKEADIALELAGHRRLKPWKSARHGLLPAPRGKTRECWSAQLDGGTDGGRVAVIDLPPAPTGSGVHCPDCCRNFTNTGAWELHRKRQRDGRYLCVDPASVTLVGHVTLARSASHNNRPTPMLKRSIGGVWAIDPAAVWGPDGPPLTPEQVNTLYWDAQRAVQARPWQFGKGHNRR